MKANFFFFNNNNNNAQLQWLVVAGLGSASKEGPFPLWKMGLKRPT